MASSSSTTGSTRMWLPVDKLLHTPVTHREHPQLLCIEASDPRNSRRYHYLSWQVMHPPTPVVWSNNVWYEFHHSLASGRPYHQGVQVKVYPTLVYPDTEEETDDSTNVQIRNTPALIDISGPGSPHCTRSNEQGTPSRLIPINDTHNSNPISTQTMATMTETISQTIAPGGDNDAPPPNTSNHHQNPQHIRDTFNITLRRAPGGPRGPGGPGDPNRPRGPNATGGIPSAHLIPIQPAGDLKPA